MFFAIDPFLTILLSSILVVAAINDIRVRKIPNLLTFPTMVLGLIYYSIVNGWDGLFFSFGGLALGMAIFFVPYLTGGMGAGDAKLMGAVGAIIGPKGVLIAALFSAVIGGVYALIILLFNIQYLRGFITRSALTVKTFAFTRNFVPIPADEAEHKPKLCFGVAITIGTLFYVLLNFYGCKFPF